MIRIASSMFALVLFVGLLAGCPAEEPDDNQSTDNQSTEDAGADADDGSDADNGDSGNQQNGDETTLTLDSIYPVEGVAGGGDETSLYGAGFTEDSEVRFGTETAEIEFVSETQINATTPGGEPGAVDVTVENPDGSSATLEGGFTYLEPEETVTIGWCNLQHPESTTTSVGEETELIFGRVYVENCTGTDTECEPVTGQLGIGPEDGDPTAAAESYEFYDAEYNAEHSGDNNDEHMTTVTPDTEGTYRYVFRFSGNGGADWMYCDLEPGTSDGFSADQQGTLTVEP